MDSIVALMIVVQVCILIYIFTNAPKLLQQTAGVQGFPDG